MPIAKPDERIGIALIGKYKLSQWLATGGMGVLYAASHVHTGRRVAVKMLRPKDQMGALDVQRFMREARAAALLSHPNVVDIYDVDVDAEGTPFLVMELLAGESLGTVLRREGRVSVENALAWLLPIMGAAAAAHDRGLLHRDLKPDNVFLSRDHHGRCVPKLLDFGLSKALDEEGPTRSGTVLGTPAFMAPEQVREEGEVGKSADVWSMGVMLFLLLAGKLPREAATTPALLVRIVNQPTPLLSSMAPHVPLRLASAIDRALETSLDVRYRDMRELARALAEAAHAEGFELPESPDPIGLPEWPSWLAQLERPSQATRSLSEARVTARAALAAEPAATRVVAAATGRAATSAQKLMLALACVALAFAVWLALHAATVREQEQTPSPSAAVVREPEATPPASVKRADEPAPVAPPPVPPTAAGVAVQAPAAAATAAPSSAKPRRATRRARAVPAANGAKPQADELQLETEWK